MQEGQGSLSLIHPLGWLAKSDPLAPCHSLGSLQGGGRSGWKSSREHFQSYTKNLQPWNSFLDLWALERARQVKQPSGGPDINPFTGTCHSLFVTVPSNANCLPNRSPECLWLAMNKIPQSGSIGNHSTQVSEILQPSKTLHPSLEGNDLFPYIKLATYTGKMITTCQVSFTSLLLSIKQCTSCCICLSSLEQS